MERKKDYFPLNIRRIRERWDMIQDGFAGYTRGQITTYEKGRVEAPPDLAFWCVENTGLKLDDLYFREISQNEIPLLPLFDGTAIITEEAQKERRKARLLG